MTEDILVSFKTVQGTTIKGLFESLKEILNDVNIRFDKTGMKITAMDGNKCACVHIKLDSDKFEQYQCNSNMVTAGVNMSSLFKLVKTIGSHDTVSFVIYKNKPFELHIFFSNEVKNTSTTSILKLLDIDEDIYQIPDVQFDSQINMPSVDFQKYCRDLSVISDYVEIKSSDTILEFNAFGDFANQKIQINQTSNGMIITKSNKTVSGKYSLKYLNLFTKSTNLSNIVEMYLMTNYPLILVYYVGNLGKLQYCLAPKSTD
jgi:proliferating cell nuclear antigen